MRYAAFDIETTGLDASYGRLLCGCFKFSDRRKPITVVAPRYDDEPEALREIAAIFDSADIVVTWNGKLFDLPFVNARLMVRRDETGGPLILDPGKKHVDLRWQSAKLRTRGNRLEGASIDLRARNRKYDVDAESWVRAADGDRKALDEIVRHCEQDVRITEEMFEIFQPYITRITR